MRIRVLLELGDAEEAHSVLECLSEWCTGKDIEGAEFVVEDLEEEAAEEDVEEEPCQHHTAYASGARDGQCTVCGELAEGPTSDDAGPAVREHLPVREFDPIPVPWRYFRVARELYERRKGVAALTLAVKLRMEQREVYNALQYFKRYELAECQGCHHGRWRASAKLRAHGVHPDWKW